MAIRKFIEQRHDPDWNVVPWKEQRLNPSGDVFRDTANIYDAVPRYVIYVISIARDRWRQVRTYNKLEILITSSPFFLPSMLRTFPHFTAIRIFLDVRCHVPRYFASEKLFHLSSPILFQQRCNERPCTDWSRKIFLFVLGCCFTFLVILIPRDTLKPATTKSEDTSGEHGEHLIWRVHGH